MPAAATKDQHRPEIKIKNKKSPNLTDPHIWKQPQKANTGHSFGIKNQNHQTGTEI